MTTLFLGKFLYIYLSASVTIDFRFCDYEETTTDHGNYTWNETAGGGAPVEQPCALGPAEGFSTEDASARRQCNENGEWEEEALSQCITIVSLRLQELEQTINEVSNSGD